MLAVMLIQIIVKLMKAKITEQVLESRKRKIKHSRQGNNDLVNIWLPWCSDGKESSCSAGDPGSIPGLGRSPGGGRGNPLQYSCPENPWTEGPGGLHSVGSQSGTQLSGWPQAQRRDVPEPRQSGVTPEREKMSMRILGAEEISFKNETEMKGHLREFVSTHAL